MRLRLCYDLDRLDNVDYRAIDRLNRVVHPFLMRYFRAEVRGLARIPEGPALYVGNHSGGLVTPDSFVFGSTLQAERGPRDVPVGLAHDVASRIPVAHQILALTGGVRASHENAHRVFGQGRKAIVYPGGDLDTMRPFRHRDRIVFGGRVGYMELALREGVPVIPVVSAGGQETLLVIDDMRWLARLLRVDRLLRVKVWPLAVSIPWGITLGPVPFHVPLPARILVEVLEPFTFERTGEAAARDASYVRACADRVEGAMQETLSRLEAERRRMRWWRRLRRRPK